MFIRGLFSLNGGQFRARFVGKTGSKRQLDFRQIILRVAFEDHARAFDVDFARGFVQNRQAVPF